MVRAESLVDGYYLCHSTGRLSTPKWHPSLMHYSSCYLAIAGSSGYDSPAGLCELSMPLHMPYVVGNQCLPRE